MMFNIDDSVCGRSIAGDILNHMEYLGQRYDFCSYHCLAKLHASPAMYAKTNPVVLPAANNPIVPVDYTCPMHPEIHQYEL